MIEVKVPELAESITEGTIAKWLVNVGDKVEKGDDIVELETDKVNIQISAEDSGVLKETKKDVDDTVEVGEIIAVLDENGEAGGTAASEGKPEAEKKEAPAKEAKEEAPKAETTEETGERHIASPAARKLAREKGIDLSEVKSRDPLGRIRTEDVKNHSEGGSKQETKASGEAKKAPQPAAQDPGKPSERIKMSRRRQTIANRLVDVQHTAAMLTTFNEVDMTAVMDLRKRRKDAFLKKHDVKLGFMSFFTKAVVGALKEFPLLNAEIQGNEILVKKYYDIGIAVAAEEGLVVPVVRDADRLGFAGIEREIGTLAAKARDNSLGLKELTGGSFTITNGGTFGSLMSTPILNAPQVGILGMHSIQRRPVTVQTDEGEKIETRPMMYIALSYDHRIVDGSEAVRFLVRIKQMLEDPEQLLLEG
ncbi:2-oxoglutarate dehydrogenase E2 component [Scopulibacillus darangshiensis]|uniref:Dihydrolipoyllysine-residue succinyltransferase component of 2-oxoglutarate dehydrogenase complex n=1 Tax=Scopulibacillus darangshiensis TaxID=442528 RepID=A0A4R2NB05_9BACL|nr:2-oxoglutarate dehydrogenase complex dihydrolipoyllysine-residue succinyltransferase [Scopulibacillus darangshiensis]TCP18319.1 2-oxoglutarate dehydrogenase E2 component [Scopulibacillus darangshiensis]